MRELLDFLGLAIALAFIVFIVSGFIHILLHLTGIWDKIAIKIKLPKRKRFLTKVTPIYEFVGDSDFSGPYIRKWELGYDDVLSLQFLMIFIPYPISLLRYTYIHAGNISLPHETKLVDITEDIKDLYERMWEEENKELMEKQRKKKVYQDNLDRVNQVFNENYEK